MDSSKPKINNTFKDKTTGLSFLIPSSHQLKRSEAERKVRRWIAQQEARLFKAWKARKANQEWSGDEKEKGRELFRDFSSRRRGLINILTDVPKAKR